MATTTQMLRGHHGQEAPTRNILADQRIAFPFISRLIHIHNGHTKRPHCLKSRRHSFRLPRMRKRYTPSEWMRATEQDPGLRGLSPADTATRLNITEQEVGELVLSGTLNVSDICEDGEVVNVVIPERDIKRYAAQSKTT